MRVTWNRDYFWLQKLKKLLETKLAQHILKSLYKASLSRYSPCFPKEEVLTDGVFKVELSDFFTYELAKGDCSGIEL